MTTTDLRFSPYDEAIHDFHQAGGKRVLAIRTPRRQLDEFRQAFPAQADGELAYQESPVQLVESQDVVSVRGTTSVGHMFEWPEPDMAWAAQDA